MCPQELRELADVIARPLLITLHRSWQMGEVPKDWMKADVTPTLKKGKEEDPGNYWPVSHTPIPGKVMEPFPGTQMTRIPQGIGTTWLHQVEITADQLDKLP